MTGAASPEHLHFADDLELLLSGRLLPEAFESRYRAHAKSQAFAELMDAVAHFLADADIRSRDTEYRAMQEDEMRRLISCLRAGRLDAARRVTFLRASRDGG